MATDPSDLSVVEERKHNVVREPLERHGLYHSFRLPNGSVLRGSQELEWQEARLASFGLPESLAGKKALDIGPWDGFFTFELERRGAAMTAIDYVDLDTFRQLRRAFGSTCRYLRMDVYELAESVVGRFDYVLCLGVLYHLKYPIEGLERICAITDEICIVDTFVSDGKEWLAGVRPPIPYAEFYETAELGGQLDNWVGPSVSAVAAWIRSAGFARAELLRVTDSTATFAAHRKWNNVPAANGPKVHLTALSHNYNRGRTFNTRKEEYISLWAEWPEENAGPSLASIYPEVDGFGLPPMHVNLVSGLLHTQIRVPPGLTPGRHEVKLRVGTLDWSDPMAFYVDLPPLSTPIALSSMQDGISWTKNEVDWENGGWLTLWVDGLSPEADPGSTTVEIGDIPHSPTSVHPETGQVNIQLRPIVATGIHNIVVYHRSARTSARPLTVRGTPPTIRGLEAV